MAQLCWTSTTKLPFSNWLRWRLGQNGGVIRLIKGGRDDTDIVNQEAAVERAFRCTP